MKPEEEQRHLELADKLLGEQNFAVAFVSGMVTTILGCGVYAATAIYAGGESVSVIVIAVGAAIGFTMQFLGRGITTRFAIAAAVLGLASLPLSKLFTIALYTSKADGIPPAELLSNERLAEMWAWVLSGLRLVDLVFWVAAIGTAAFFSKRRLTRDEDQAMYTFKLAKR